MGRPRGIGHRQDPGRNVRRPIATAPRDGTLIRLWCRSLIGPTVGYFHSGLGGWVADDERFRGIRHDVTAWEPAAAPPISGLAATPRRKP